MYTLVIPSLSTKFIENIHQNLPVQLVQFSQYSGTKLDMLLEIAKSVEIVIVLRKNSCFTLKCFISCTNTILLLLLST